MKRDAVPGTDPGFTLAEDQIRDLASARSFERGEDCYDAGAVSAAVLEGCSLHARCQGSRPEPYRVTVVLGEDRVLNYSCSCPFSGEGCCKHVVAVLLTFTRDPGTLATAQSVRAMLSRRTSEELADLVIGLAEQHRLLADVIDALDELDISAELLSDPDVVTACARELERLQSRFLGWRQVDTLVRRLGQLRTVARALWASGSRDHALAVLHLVSVHIMRRARICDDIDGHLARFLSNALAELEKYLQDVPPSTPERQACMVELEHVAVDPESEAPQALFTLLARSCQVEDTRRAQPVLETALRQSSPDSGPFPNSRRRSIVDLLLRLYDLTGQHRAYLDLCWEEERDLPYALKLLEIGQMEGSLQCALTRFTQTREYLALATALLDAGHRDEAVTVARAAETAVGPKEQVWRWLSQVYASAGNTGRALALLYDVFVASPSPERYGELSRLASELGRWEEIRPRLLSELRRSARRQVLLEILLREGDLDGAFNVATDLKLDRHGWERLAAAASKQRPDLALQAYRHLIDETIARGNRSAYRVAARKAAEMKQLCVRSKEPAAWRDYVAELRARHRRRTALLAELGDL